VCGVRPCGRGAFGRPSAIVPCMAQLIAVFLGATAWVGGVLVIVVSWHRIVSDDPRLLNLLAQVCDPDHRAALDQKG
jgi:hypothetical protein